MKHREVPSRQEQLALLEDPELRADRQAWRKESLPPPGHRLRGRRRAEIEKEKSLALSMPPVEIEVGTVRSLRDVVAERQPLFDQFTRHHQVRPTQRSIDNYVNSGSNRKVDGKSIGPKPITEFPALMRPIVLASRHRQYNYLCDNLQRETFDDRNIARSRRYSLMATNYFIKNDLPLDASAAKVAADALVDFGHTLNDKHNQVILDDMHDHDLGFQIIRIGTLASDDFEVLKTNSQLMQLVQKEQRTREGFWGEIYDATKAYFPVTRLINPHREAGAELQEELDRLASICPLVLDNLPPQPVIGDYESRRAA